MNAKAKKIILPCLKWYACRACRGKAPIMEIEGMVYVFFMYLNVIIIFAIIIMIIITIIINGKYWIMNEINNPFII